MTHAERELDTREAKLERLMREHSARVLAYAYHRDASRLEAEDAVAEVFLVCWRRLDDVPAESLPWLLGITRKVLANQRRSRHRREALQTRLEQNVASLGRDRDSVAAGVDSGAGVLAGLARLKEADREALLLVAWDGLSQKQAAQVLGISRAAFRLRFHLAQGRLLRHLEDMRTSNELESNIDRREAP